MRRRITTDKGALAAGLCVVLWMLYTASDIWANLELRRIGRGFDWRGRQCGVDVPGHPWVIWPRLPTSSKIDPTSPLCIKKCPVTDDVTLLYPSRTAKTETLSDGQKIITVTVKEIPTLGYASIEVWGSLCLPVEAKAASSLAQKIGLTDRLPAATQLLRSLRDCWPALIVAALTCGLLSLLYIYMISQASPILAWFAAIGSPLTLGTTSILLCILYCWSFPGDNATTLLTQSLITPLRPLLLGFGIIGLCTAVAVACAHAALWRQARNAARFASIEAACLANNLWLLFVPLITSIIVIAIWAIGITILVGILTTRLTPSILSTARSVNGYYLDDVPAKRIFSDNSNSKISYLNDIDNVFNFKTDDPTKVLFNGMLDSDMEKASVHTVGLIRQFDFSRVAIMRALLWVGSLMWLLGSIEAAAQLLVAWAVAKWGRKPPLGAAAALLRIHAGTLFLAGLFRAAALILTLIMSIWAGFSKALIRNTLPYPVRYGINYILRTIMIQPPPMGPPLGAALVLTAIKGYGLFEGCREAKLLSESPLGREAALLGRLSGAAALSHALGLSIALCAFSVLVVRSWCLPQEALLGTIIAMFIVALLVASVACFSVAQIGCTLLTQLMIGGSHSNVDDLRALIEEIESEHRLERLLQERRTTP